MVLRTGSPYRILHRRKGKDSSLVDNEERVQVGLCVSLGDLVLSGLRNVTAERTVFEIGTGQPFNLN